MKVVAVDNFFDFVFLLFISSFLRLFVCKSVYCSCLVSYLVCF